MPYGLPPLDFGTIGNPPGSSSNEAFSPLSPLTPFESLSNPGTGMLPTSHAIETLSLLDLMKNQHVVMMHQTATQNSFPMNQLWHENSELKAEIEWLRAAGL
jgi:hypothetical protein